VIFVVLIKTDLVRTNKMIENTYPHTHPQKINNKELSECQVKEYEIDSFVETFQGGFVLY
jgi:hypothetical protein